MERITWIAGMSGKAGLAAREDDRPFADRKITDRAGVLPTAWVHSVGNLWRE